VHADDPLKVRNYWTDVHYTYTQCDPIIAHELLKSEWRYSNPLRNSRATNKGE